MALLIGPQSYRPLTVACSFKDVHLAFSREMGKWIRVTGFSLEKNPCRIIP